MILLEVFYMSQPDNSDDIFLSVEEAAKLIKSSEKTLYVYLCNRGKNGGKGGKTIPQDIYVKFGRRTLFIKDKFIEWAKNGCQMK